MAAQAFVRRSFAEPVATYATNVMGTVNVLDAVRRARGVRVVVVVSSDKCYENREWVWGYRETEPMGATTPTPAPRAPPSWSPPPIARRSSPRPTPRGGQRAGGQRVRRRRLERGRLLPDVFRAALAASRSACAIPSGAPWQHVLNRSAATCAWPSAPGPTAPAPAAGTSGRRRRRAAVRWIVDRPTSSGTRRCAGRSIPGPTPRGAVAQARLVPGAVAAGLGAALGPRGRPAAHRRLAPGPPRRRRRARGDAQPGTRVHGMTCRLCRAQRLEPVLTLERAPRDVSHLLTPEQAADDGPSASRSSAARSAGTSSWPRPGGRLLRGATS
jgi:hypothetical protein